MIFIHEKKKKVSFSKHVHVILIPSRMEYISYGMYKYLWYSDYEYRRFILEKSQVNSPTLSLSSV